MGVIKVTSSEQELIIKTYFHMWVDRNFSSLDKIFSADIYYSECYGPEYFGLSEIHRWIDDMLEKQQVLAWEIKQFIHEKNTNTVVVEWYFKEQQNLNVNDFNGVSIIKFSADGKISSIKEFESKSEHSAPYHSS
ncbi:nuclear transport factor 2 family protein [Photobacterium kishitanii]|uniref:Nuclear transport factor 2 family protein n=1 Tax=Photobacterium kishitanii TaxID=318456 RepID=A0AAX0YXA7_9GAMM|nr:hypothetical protein UB40_04165 [Photobacterium kishitanii]PSV05963.1 nuclear transport factor 2 family protein [Photobacterium kishitanii]PSV74845.1 nuclear transport factor 2 family protein [Photobacterium kishitanii]PSX20917.1 nuclear transport factor 2 family protein [Photobacterium kishitanii]PSX28369.1 nuclear transport factor 2 family protein [Photobacterium kishitanii]